MSKRNVLFVIFSVVVSCIAMNSLASQNFSKKQTPSQIDLLLNKIELQQSPDSCAKEIKALKEIFPQEAHLGDIVVFPQYAQTILMFAAGNCNVQWVEYLLQDDVTLTLKDSKDCTAFLYAKDSEFILAKRRLNPLRENSEQAKQNAEKIMTLLKAKEDADKIRFAMEFLNQKAQSPSKLATILMQQPEPNPKRRKTASIENSSKKNSQNNTQNTVHPQIAALHSQILHAAVRRMPDQNIFDALADGAAEVFANKFNANASAAPTLSVDSQAQQEPQTATQSSHSKSKRQKPDANASAKPRPLTPAQAREKAKEHAKQQRREQREKESQAAQAAAAALEREHQEAERAREEKAASERRMQEQSTDSAQPTNPSLISDESPALGKEKKSRQNTQVRTSNKNQRQQRAEHRQHIEERIAAAAAFEALKTPVIAELATPKSKTKSQRQLDQEAEEKAEREAIRSINEKLVAKEAERELQKLLIAKADAFYNKQLKKDALKTWRFTLSARENNIQTQTQKADNFYRENLKLKALKAMSIQTTMNQHDAQVAGTFNRQNIQRDAFSQLKGVAKALRDAKKAAEAKEFAEMCQKAEDFSVLLNQEQEKQERVKDFANDAINAILYRCESDWDHHQLFLSLPLEPMSSAFSSLDANAYLTNNTAMLRVPSIDQ